MPIKVVQWGIGNVGRMAIRNIVARPEFELAGVMVTNPDTHLARPRMEQQCARIDRCTREQRNPVPARRRTRRADVPRPPSHRRPQRPLLPLGALTPITLPASLWGGSPMTVISPGRPRAASTASVMNSSVGCDAVVIDVRSGSATR